VGVPDSDQSVPLRPDPLSSTGVDTVLQLGASGNFDAARAQLDTLLKASWEPPEKRALLRAFLALLSAALGDVDLARRVARQVVHETARPSKLTPRDELRLLRYARALAARTSVLIGDRIRGQRAARAQSVSRDPASLWLMTQDVARWQDAPAEVRAVARFLHAVEQRYATFPTPGLLTPTEVSILQFVQRGLSAPKVALRMERSPHTIRTHLRNAYAKLGASGRADAIAKARRLGLLESS
jgi:DNA-binding CsgD family transcriptional regulator